MKKLLSLFLVLALSISLCIPAYAAVPSTSNENDVISFEEYNTAVTNEYAKLHIKYDCTSYDKDFVFTKGLLKQKLEDINNDVRGFTYDTSTNSFVSSVPVTESSVSSVPVITQTVISPRVAYADIDHYVYVTATSPSQMGSAQIEIKVGTTEDVQASKFIYVNSCTSRQYGYAANFQSWTHQGSDLGINSTRSMISGFVSGTLVVAYTEIKTGMSVTYTSDHTWNIGFTTSS